MTINCVWEHNQNDTLLYAEDFVGAHARGKNLEEAIAKMPSEIICYARWLGCAVSEELQIQIVGEKQSQLDIRDADSDVIF